MMRRGITKRMYCPRTNPMLERVLITGMGANSPSRIPATIPAKILRMSPIACLLIK